MRSEYDNGHQSSSLNNVQSKTFTLGTENLRKLQLRQEFFWSSKKITLHGYGVAKRMTLQPLSRSAIQLGLLNEIRNTNLSERELMPGEGTCAFGAFPFDPNQSAELIIPRIILGKHASGERWVTYTSELDLSYDDIIQEIENTNVNEEHPPITEINVDSPIKPEIWRDKKIPAIKDLINNQIVKKVVLARELILTANKEIPIETILEKLKDNNTESMIFNIDGFIGASPELLVSRFGNSVRANPLAGTATRHREEKADKQSKQELLDSTKDAYEH